MKIVTWNVNSLRARLPRVQQLLADLQPDVLLLQETKCDPDEFCTDELTALGYDSVHHSAGRWAGVAIVARAGLQLRTTATGLPGELREDEARWIEAAIDPPDAMRIRVISTYVTNGRALDSPWFDEKLAFLDAAAARIGGLRAAEPSLPIVLGGDFNVTRDDSDVWDPEAFIGSTHVTQQERARLADILDAGQLVDAYRYVHPDEPQFTWWDYRQGAFHRGMGLRIDYLMVSAQLADGLAGCGIARDFRKGTKPSDHAPLVLKLST